uniref:Uncharacterized protein n=1 Tax=Lepeophtheirus salmonis TaxID=72036 RepID=A0A0K2UDF6_LEPSM
METRTLFFLAIET